MVSLVQDLRAQVDRDFAKLKEMTALSQYIQLFHGLKKAERQGTIERFKSKCIIGSRSRKLVVDLKKAKRR